MIKFGKAVVKSRIVILISSVLLLIPALLGYISTRINYDVLTYLPEEIETMKGQEIMIEDFGTGAFSMFIVDGMELKDVAELKAKTMWRRFCGMTLSWTYPCPRACSRIRYTKCSTRIRER